MKKYIYQGLASIFCLTSMCVGYGEEGLSNQSFSTSLDEVKEYLDSRGFVETRKKSGTLKIAGDIRARWLYANESVQSDDVTVIKPLVNTYRSEYSLLFDYAAKNTWMTSHISGVAKAVGESGVTSLNIRRAFLGYRFYENPETQTDVFAEIGRSGLGSMFESKVQFDSDFDGIHLYYSHQFSEKYPFRYIVHGGPFVVNMVNKQYAWCVEGIVNQLPKNFLVKVSVVDWNSFTTVRSAESASTPADPVEGKYKYLVWQYLVGKHSQIPFFGTQKNLYVYGAYLFNSLAEPSMTTANSKQNRAWYIGGTLGGLRKAGDWSVTACYEYVEALAVPEIDAAGIGRGNQKHTFYAAIAESLDPSEANGFTNYKGVSGLFMYSITDSLSYRVYGAHSTPADRRLGNNFSYTKFDVGMISSF